MWTENTGAEMYGCLVYNVGSNHWDHGIYVQNQTGTKRVADNIVVNAASHGIHAYGSSRQRILDNITLEGNTIYESGILGGSAERNILLGGLRVAQNPVVVIELHLLSRHQRRQQQHRLFRGRLERAGEGQRLGRRQRRRPPDVQRRHGHRQLVHRSARSDRHDVALAVEHGLGVAADDGQQIFVRKNTYEPGRAHITIYNWAKAAHASRCRSRRRV